MNLIRQTKVFLTNDSFIIFTSRRETLKYSDKYRQTRSLVKPKQLRTSTLLKKQRLLLLLRDNKSNECNEFNKLSLGIRLLCNPLPMFFNSMLEYCINWLAELRCKKSHSSNN